MIGEMATLDSVQTRKRNSSSLSSIPYTLSSTPGFTLIELLIVIALLGIMTAIVYPSVGRGLSTLRLKTASREVAAAMRLARSKALREQQMYHLQFDPENSQIFLLSQDLSYQRSFVLPQGITLRRISRPGGRAEVPWDKAFYYFAPNGLSESFELVLGNDRNREVKVSLNSLTGSPRIEDVLEDARVR